MNESDTLGAIRSALYDPNVALRLVPTFTHGTAVQVYIKTRKIGPILISPEGGTAGDTLRMLADLYDSSAIDTRPGM